MDVIPENTAPQNPFPPLLTLFNYTVWYAREPLKLCLFMCHKSSYLRYRYQIPTPSLDTRPFHRIAKYLCVQKIRNMGIREMSEIGKYK